MQAHTVYMALARSSARLLAFCLLVARAVRAQPNAQSAFSAAAGSDAQPPGDSFGGAGLSAEDQSLINGFVDPATPTVRQPPTARRRPARLHQLRHAPRATSCAEPVRRQRHRVPQLRRRPRVQPVGHQRPPSSPEHRHRDRRLRRAAHPGLWRRQPGLRLRLRGPLLSSGLRGRRHELLQQRWATNAT